MASKKPSEKTVFVRSEEGPFFVWAQPDWGAQMVSTQIEQPSTNRSAGSCIDYQERDSHPWVKRDPHGRRSRCGQHFAPAADTRKNKQGHHPDVRTRAPTFTVL